MSDGVAIVRKLLVAASAVTGLVPASRIVAGPLPQGAALPAISITSVAATDLNTLAAGAKRRVTELVQITVLAATYPSQKAVQRAAKNAVAHKFPTVSGASEISAITATTGPDFMDAEAAIYCGTQDVNVSFNQPTT